MKKIILFMCFYIFTLNLYGQTFTKITSGAIVNDGGSSTGSNWVDIDNDNDLDLFVANTGFHNNFLYLNNGNSSFTKITNGVIIQDSLSSGGSSWGDYDNDGDLDLFVPNWDFDNNSLYQNNGNGTFNKIIIGEIVNDGMSCGSSSWADYNNDGFLDMFVCTASDNFLYMNNGDGIFVRITNGPLVTEGGSNMGSWANIDNDSDLDLFVANYGNNYLYINNGDGTFNKNTSSIIVSENETSHGGSWGDYDNDGDLDLFVTNMNENNILYQNNGDSTFNKITTGSIVNDGGWSHSSSWGDYDNDGDLDLFVSNSGNENNSLYWNNGDGSFNKDISGIIVNDSGWTWASVCGDYDNDGDLDIFVTDCENNNNSLYQNDGNSNNWINIKCIGILSNRSAIGTRISIKSLIGGSPIWQTREISGLTGFHSQNSLNVHFGLGDASIIDSILIKWPSGIVQTLTNINVNQFLNIIESTTIPIAEIQNDPSLFIGQTVTIEGVVTQGAGVINNIDTDIYIQDNSGKGIKVFRAGSFLTDLTRGSLVNITGMVEELQDITQINNFTYSILSTGNQIPIPLFLSTSQANNISNEGTFIEVIGDVLNIVHAGGGTNIELNDGSGSVVARNWDISGIDLSSISNGDNVAIRGVLSVLSSVGQLILSYQEDFDKLSLDTPTLIAPSDGSTNIPITQTFEWNAVNTATEYRLQLAYDMNFSNLARDNQGSFTSFQHTNLDPEITYFWRVNATNGTNFSDWSNIWSFTTMALPILTTQAATNVTDVSAQLNAMVNPNNVKIGIGFEYGETSSYSHYVQATPDTLFNASSSPVSAVIGGLLTDRDYHFRVVAQSGDGSIFVHGDEQVFHTASYPTTMDFSSPIYQFQHHDDLSLYTSQDYRIIGIPGGTISKSFADIMQGVHGTDWQAYFDNGVDSGNPEDYLVEYNGGSEFHFGEGRAFWIIYKGDLMIQEQGVPTIGLNAFEEAEIYLHPGWNLITNPFDRPIEWWKIQQSNTIGPINHFDGTGNWLNSDDHFTNFEPFIGYYVFTQNGMTLLIPYGATSQSVSSRPENHTWKMDVSLSVEGKNISSSKLGVSKLAMKNLDNLDYRKPRAIGAMPSIYFNRPEWDDRYSIFACDMRPEIQDVEKWEFTVSNIINQKTTISFSGIENIPSQHEVFLLDEIRSTFVNLREKSEYSFNPVISKSNFSVLVGNQQTILEELENLIPTEFKLGKNFPNPFNPSTTIPVSVPEESELTLKVYNILGQEIKTIFDGTRETGRHYFRWDGTNYLNQQVAAGIYLFRMITDKGYSFVGKMVLVK